MNTLYPLKFEPIILDKIWGGNKLKTILNKENATNTAGESWEISTVDNKISVVSEGFLKSNTLTELIEIYMGDLVGDKVYEKFGLSFPLLIKFIDATQDLSIQVHPNNEIALKRHNSFGKTEMWYIIQADEGSELISGFKKDVTKEEYLTHLKNNTLNKILNYEPVKKEDSFFIPAGRVHAIGTGILLAEIQQASDTTYRIYDFNRKDKEGNTRELHTEEARDVIDYKAKSQYYTSYEKALNKTVNISNCEFFTTNIISLNKTIEKDYIFIDSFVIYMCTSGKLRIKYSESKEVILNFGETILIPAELKNLELIPMGESKLLEIYINGDLK